MQRRARLVAAFALAFAAGALLAGDDHHVSLVPWRLHDRGAELHAPLVLFWVPASRDELRRSDLLTSDELTAFAAQCVAMRVVRFDDLETLAKLEIEGELPVAVLVDGAGVVVSRVEGEGGALHAHAVELMVREELELRIDAANDALDAARAKADAGEIDAAIAIYRTVWEQRCLCPREAKDAQRALRKLKAPEK